MHVVLVYYISEKSQQVVLTQRKKKHQDKEKLECFFPRDGCTSNRLLENTPTIALNDSPSGTAIQKNRLVGTSWK